MVKSTTASLRTASKAVTTAPSPRMSKSRLLTTNVFLPAGVPDQEPLEAFDDLRPVEGLHRGPRPSPHRCHERRLAREPDRRRDEALPVALPDRQAAHAALDVHVRRGVVIRDH